MSEEKTSSSKDFNDAQAHYNTLISAFKYLIICGTGFATIISIGVGFFIFQNGKELRENVQSERVTLQTQFSNMRSDVADQKKELLDKEKEMNNRVDNYIKTSQVDIDATKMQALLEIRNIQEVAKQEARKRIEQIFEKENLNEFVIKAAEEHIRPQVNRIIDSVRNANVMFQIQNLKSSSSVAQGYAYTYLASIGNEPLTEKHLEGIIDAINTSDNRTLKFQLATFLTSRNSSLIRNFFEAEAAKGADVGEFSLSYTSIYYLLSHDIDFGILEKYINRSEKKNIQFVSVVNLAIGINKSITLKLLDNKRLVDEYYQRPVDNDAEQIIPQLITNLEVEKINFKTLYFFTKHISTFPTIDLYKKQ